MRTLTWAGHVRDVDSEGRAFAVAGEDEGRALPDSSRRAIHKGRHRGHVHWFRHRPRVRHLDRQWAPERPSESVRPACACLRATHFEVLAMLLGMLSQVQMASSGAQICAPGLPRTVQKPSS